MTVREKIEKGFELANYLVLTLLITAQCTVGSNFFVGQFIYFSANVLAVVRCFILRRPMADKVKDFCMLGITTGLILIKFLGGIRSQKGDLKMKKYNPYLEMTYKNGKLIMTPETFKMWLQTYKLCNERQMSNIIERVDYFTRDKKNCD